MLRHPGRLQESVEEHRRIVGAFMVRDADAANQEVKQHILVSADLLKQIVAQPTSSGVSAAG
jgi:DNA-binding FadR family transcriptional regulator